MQTVRETEREGQKEADRKAHMLICINRESERD